ncbi:Por secretion system C-terminal sorting domain-containing protein [Flavobacterium gillisiae]|uniref:Por secretion system C-terminal sorting domain-containing protein n=1 Tax=Flavobacterium gillisiae TaxID=150146 RepID=A0A1H3XDQ7_9FLAO|nr:T9SS type A sorting domain-containing protein [Flavobacterium gillisiae]SDZ96678.1 Por secretion system C-terminal sorting domain-containing protein [Flavobacterium gillisiae]
MNTKILKQSFLLVAGFLFQLPVQSQMYVSSNSYVYSSNVAVFIKQDLELNATSSNFYLRNDAQLLQGTSGTSSNKGLGNLSVFQEGTTNNFQYNYWCSPVGGNIASAGNSPFGITQLRDIVDLTTSNAPTILATNNYNGTASPFAIAPYWIWKLPVTSLTSWVYVGAASTINAGEGFTMKGTSGTNTTSVNGIQNNPGSKQRYDFRGKPNDGTISIPVLFEELILTGNPYPSAIDLSAFLTAATNSTGIAYFWEQDKTVNSHFIADYKGGYGAFSPGALNSVGVYVPATFYSYDGSGNQGVVTGTGGNYERRFSPVGQGFMIEGSANGAVEMKNSYRVFVKEGAANYSQFEKNTSQSKTNKTSAQLASIASVSGYDYSKVSVDPTPQIRLNTLLNSQGVRQLALAFIPEATDGVDHAMDALSTSDDSPADVYFVMNDNEYVINALSFDIDKKIAIGFRNTAEANYKITVNKVLNFTGAENIYLHNKTADTYHDIKNSFYDLTLAAGVNNTQFEITFKKGVTLGIDSQESKSFIMYQNNTTKNLTINNPKQKELVACNLYDIVGKLIFAKKDLGSNIDYSFSTAGLSDGIYIVKLSTTEDTDIGQKVIIKN